MRSILQARVIQKEDWNIKETEKGSSIGPKADDGNPLDKITGTLNCESEGKQNHYKWTMVLSFQPRKAKKLTKAHSQKKIPNEFCTRKQNPLTFQSGFWTVDPFNRYIFYLSLFEKKDATKSLARDRLCAKKSLSCSPFIFSYVYTDESGERMGRGSQMILWM